MTDSIDTAQAYAEHLTAQALQQHHARQQLTHDTAGALDCIDCGAPIPALRRAALPFTTRCVDCQARVERYPSTLRRR